MGRYLTAAVCIRGHTISDAIERVGAPVANFCPECGAKVVVRCANCNTPIRGDYYVERFFGASDYVRPAFCFHCGEPFPWTVAKLDAAKQLADEVEELSPEDRGKLKDAISDIATTGPRTELGAARIKRLLGNATTGLGQALWKISVEIASEAAKKIMLGG
jgi:hypothetical protein